ncbi:MAG: RIP metalloprotease RseP, partial [Quisquiliibacterium sp.]
MTMIQTVFAVLVALTLLIFVHELGHFLVARWCGVKVLRFSIGFGPPLFARRFGRDQTEWVVAAIPLGGYVKMLDEHGSDTEQIASADLPHAFSRQPLRKRAAIVAAGPAANFLLAIGFYLLLNGVGMQEPVARLASPPSQTAAAIAGLQGGDRILSIDGVAVQSWRDVRLGLLDAMIDRATVSVVYERDSVERETWLSASGMVHSNLERDYLSDLGLEIAPGRISIASILPDSPAQGAGLQPGDQVLSVNGRTLLGARSFIDLIRASSGVALRLEILRGGDPIRLEIVPVAHPSDRAPDRGKAVGRIGARISERLEMAQVRHLGLDGLTRSIAKTWEMSAFTLRMLGRMVLGEVSWRNLSGPVAIADYAGQTARIGWQAYVSFLALISISLGV